MNRRAFLRVAVAFLAVGTTPTQAAIAVVKQQHDKCAGRVSERRLRSVPGVAASYSINRMFEKYAPEHVKRGSYWAQLAWVARFDRRGK